MEIGKELTREEIAELWGGELPEIEPEYRQLADAFTQGRPELAPYVMKKVFTLREARAACSLPGTAESVAELLGISISSTYELMNECDFPVLQIGSRKVVPKEKFREWVEDHTSGSEAGHE